MAYQHAEKIIIPRDATPAELCNLLADIANAMSQIADTVAAYVADAKRKEGLYKRAYAIAIINNKNAGSAEIRKAYAEIDELVCSTKRDMEQADTLVTLAEAEQSGYESQFIAVRKIVEIRKMELQGGGGY